MRKHFTLFLLFQFISIAASHAHADDPRHEYDRQRRISPPVPPAQYQQQTPMNSQAIERRQRDSSQSRLQSQTAPTPISPLPQPQVVSIDRMQVSPEGFQPDAPTEYQAQPVPMFAAQQPLIQLAEAAEPDPAEQPAEIEQPVNPEPQATPVEPPPPVEVAPPEPEPEPEPEPAPVETPPAVEAPGRSAEPPVIPPAENPEEPQE